RARDEYSGLASYISIAPGSGTDAAVQDGADKDASGEAAPSGSPDGSSADSLLPVDDQGNALTKSSTPGIFRAGTLLGKYEMIASESMDDPYEDVTGPAEAGSFIGKEHDTAGADGPESIVQAQPAGEGGAGTGSGESTEDGAEDSAAGSAQDTEEGYTVITSAAAETAGERKDGSADDGKKVYISYPRLDIDYKHLKEVNEDFVGVLFVPCLDIVYPVAQSHDNKEYLRKTFEGNYNAAGCIFMDAYANPDMSDTNTFILGHNMRDLSMFGSLKTLETNPELCPRHPYFYLYTPGKVYKYAIFAYCTVPSKDDLYSFYDAKFDPKAYDEFIEKSMARSLYTPEEGVIDFSERPTLCTLSTCYGTGHINNFVVQGALLGAARTSTVVNAAAGAKDSESAEP
ncbi:MAG: class B sortase, partial [Lachnospiraceae bacterium]|nr:class B sortase [Lachnospiraceae bacterium]